MTTLLSYGNWETGKVLYTLTAHSDWVLSVAFSPDGQTLASGSGSPFPLDYEYKELTDDNTIKLWNLTTGEEIYIFTGHLYCVYSYYLTFFLQ